MTVTAAAVTCALLTGLTNGAVVQAAAGPSSMPAPPAVATPSAAMLPEVAMVCGAGQTNINTAPAHELMRAFTLDAPVAARLIGYRPYLAVSDLLVVEGIGADKLRQIQAAGRGCATPTSTPPPAPSPCAGVDKVDIQSATAEQIARVAGINKNAADRVVAARPFASLRHVTPERVPGVGKGNLDTVVARACLTPQPIRDAATSWRWAYPAYATTASRDGYALTAPAGVIDAASGAWLSITPLATPDNLPGPAYPRADVHIHGNWTGPRTPAGAADEVLVTVPAATFAADFDPAESAPYIKHVSGDGATRGGENVYDGGKVTVDTRTGAVTASLTSLSIVEWASRALNYVVEPAEGVLFGNRFPAPTCTSPWTQQSGTATYVSPAGAHVDLTGALLNLPGNTPPVGGFLIKHCVQNGPGASGYRGGQDARTVLRNTTGTVQVLKRYAGDVSVAGPTWSWDEDIDISEYLATQVNTGGNLYLAPGKTGTADVPAGTMGSAQMQPDRVRSLVKVGAAKILDEIFDKFGANKMYSDPKIRNWIVQMAGCVYNRYNALASGNGFANTARDFAVAAYGCFNYEGIYALIENWMRSALASGDLDGAGSVRIHKALEGLREVFKWLEFGQIAVDVSDALIWGSLPTSPILIEHYAAKPTRDDLHRIVQPACVSRNLYTWRIDMLCQDAAYRQQQQPTGGGGTTGLPAGKIIRDLDGHAWLVTTDDHKMHPIADGGTYICLAKHYAVDWAVDAQDFLGYRQASGPDGAAASCDGALAPTRKITKETAPDLFAVLRIDGGPESWIVMGGNRWPIPTGTEFNCWVNPEFRANIEVDVYDFTTRDELSTWPVGNGAISNCGDPEHPAF